MTTKNPPRLPFTPLFEDLRLVTAANNAARSDSERYFLLLAGGSVDTIPRFICDDIAKWSLENDYAGGVVPVDTKQTGPLRLPYDNFWIEWADPTAPAVRCGALIMKSNTPSEGIPDMGGDGATQLFHIILFGRSPSAMGGQVTTLCGAQASVFTDDAGEELRLRTSIDPAAARPDEANEILEAVIRSAVRYVTAAIGMMNCKNVATERHDRPAPKPSKKQRRVRKGGLAYSTIKLPGHTYDRNGFVSDNGSGGSGVSAHTVRGHSVIFTAEAPRFGRAADGIGTFWINPHVRGNRDVGQVQQLYVVAPPREEQDDMQATG